MTESNDVLFARLDENVKQVLKNQDEQKQDIKDLEKRAREAESKAAAAHQVAATACDEIDRLRGTNTLWSLANSAAVIITAVRAFLR